MFFQSKTIFLKLCSVLKNGYFFWSQPDVSSHFCYQRMIFHLVENFYQKIDTEFYYVPLNVLF
jgi:hypothetical protein